ncbi:MAG: prepilin-type N-terminal cleavage/methylation domain-containing protein [Patescibacteria group bacterium]|jgi:hypothetical protein
MKEKNILKFIPNSNKKGFTLIELLVSLSILIVVVLSAIGIYINIIGTRSKSLGQLNLQEDGQYIMSLIVKDIRAGRIDYANYIGGGGDDTCGSIVSPAPQLCLLDSSGNKIRFKKDIIDGRGVFEKCTGNPCSDYQTITMINLGVERLDFYINPSANPFTAGSTTYIHPRVTIILKLKSLIEKPGEKQIILEQTIPQRYELKK